MYGNNVNGFGIGNPIHHIIDDGTRERCACGWQWAGPDYSRRLRGHVSMAAMSS